MARSSDPFLRGFPMEPGWEREQPDPNWSAGRYHGMRMAPRPRQAAYGFHRMSREADLLGHGGFYGLYDEGPGHFEGDVFRHPSLRPTTPPRQLSGGGGVVRVEDGGVRADNRYLRQYNAASPALEGGGEGRRGFGHAPAGAGEGTLTGGTAGPEDRTQEGYNPGGFAPAGPDALDPRT
jgi:hypothetical protein